MSLPHIQNLLKVRNSHRGRLSDYINQTGVGVPNGMKTVGCK